MIRKILLILMTIVVVFPAYPIDISSLKTLAASFVPPSFEMDDASVERPGTIYIDVTGDPNLAQYGDFEGEQGWQASNGEKWTVWQLDTDIHSNPESAFGDIKQMTDLYMIHDYLDETPAHNYEAGQPS